MILRSYLELDQMLLLLLLFVGPSVIKGADASADTMAAGAAKRDQKNLHTKL